MLTLAWLWLPAVSTLEPPDPLFVDGSGRFFDLWRLLAADMMTRLLSHVATLWMVCEEFVFEDRLWGTTHVY